MATYSARAAIRGLLSGWTLAPIIYENETKPAPGQPDPWVQIELVGNLYDQVSIGSGSPPDNRWEEEGYLLAHVHVPTGTGDLGASAVAESLADFLRGVVLSGNHRFQGMSIGAGDPGDDIGPWWRLTVRADWKRG